jgi:hypothetical protein
MGEPRLLAVDGEGRWVKSEAGRRIARRLSISWPEVLTFIAGSIISINYMKTKNTLSSILCHLLVDSPSTMKILLGK